MGNRLIELGEILLGSNHLTTSPIDTNKKDTESSVHSLCLWSPNAKSFLPSIHHFGSCITWIFISIPLAVAVWDVARNLGQWKVNILLDVTIDPMPDAVVWLEGDPVDLFLQLVTLQTLLDFFQSIIIESIWVIELLKMSIKDPINNCEEGIVPPDML